MIAYYTLVSNMFDGELRQLTAVADLVIDDQGVLLKDRQGYVSKAIDVAEKEAKKFQPTIGSVWRPFDADDYLVYLPQGFYSLRTRKFLTLPETAVTPVKNVPDTFMRYVAGLEQNA